MKRLLTAALLLLPGLLLQSRAEELPGGVIVRKIWGNDMHNAFTSLIHFRGKFYCSFREGENHVYGKDGTARIITSADGKSWETAALLKLDGYDLRDPKLSVTPDGRIMVIIGGSVYRGKDLLGQLTHVSFSDKTGKNFSDPQPIRIDGKARSSFDWLWRVTWHRGKGYGIVYQRDIGISLLETADGINYNLVSKLDVDGNPNESTVRFIPGGEMLAMVRREGDDRMGMWGRSYPPYSEWRWEKMGMRLGGPDFIHAGRNILISGTRVYHENGAYTALFRGTPDGGFREILRLPSGGDSSYPGLVLIRKKLYVSYYSSHEGKSSVYFAEIPLSVILNK